MLNGLWAGMLLAGIAYGCLAGTMTAISDGVLEAARESVYLCITMTGVMALWGGLMKIAESTGLTEQMARAARPLVNWLFPDIPENHEAKVHITTNIIANILGLGWAATPSGLQAMDALAQLEEERRQQKRAAPVIPVAPGTASNEMCDFLILNISSLQLIPVNIIAYRSQYGSADPTAIIGPAIAATMVSTLAGILYCKIRGHRRRSRAASKASARRVK